MKYLIGILFLQFSFVFCQQENKIAFDFFDTSIKLYVIGESHIEDDIDLQIAMIDYILKNTKVDAFIFEIPEEVANIFNKYILSADMEYEVNTICSLLDKRISLKIKRRLEYFRNYNDSHIDKVKIKGIDSYHFYKFKKQMIGLSIIFPELKNINLPMVNKYINSRNIKNYNKKKSVNIIRSLIKEIESNMEVFSQYLGNRKVIYKEYLNNLEFNYKDTWKKTDSIRENFMSKNLIELTNSNAVCLMICGNVHATYKENDEYYDGYPFTSMTSVVKKKYPYQVFSIIVQYYEKHTPSLHEINLLDYPMKYYVENNSEPYIIFKKKDIEQYEFAKERCDMIVIKNKEIFKKRGNVLNYRTLQFPTITY
ncbi:MAG TPA: hypothetical protein PLP27_11040 [Crocinitomicaceae bacterium]|nr:hypothetical protein [Crocinitomicaceae bacterium]